jgi:hypothetical protein
VTQDFYRGGSGPVDWNAKLHEARRNARGDPITGTFYVLNGSRYQLLRPGRVVEEYGNQIAIAFDAATRQVLKHGDPGFDPDEINRVLADPAYLLELMEKAQKVRQLTDGGDPKLPPDHPQG